jgi:anhydro-N-acetylmuramic acid kinase
MSGTSLDGVDVAMLQTDGVTIAGFGPTFYRAYSDTERQLLRAALAAAATLTDRNARPGVVGEAERLVTDAHGEAVKKFLARNRIDAASVDVVGLHGQTVLHRPARRLTIQLGDGAALARRLRIPVVFDFRAVDVAAGGQGAPLAPIFHRAMVHALDRPQPVAVLNVGGVANVTLIDGMLDPFACDTGPGNALIDDFMRERTGQPHDPAGANAARGEIDQAAVEQVLTHPFFAAAPPKSLDRDDFREWTTTKAALAGKTIADGAATLTAITTASIAAVVKHLPRTPETWIVSGGGAHNTTLMRMLAQMLAPASVETADSIGWNSDALEAQAFAFLAVRASRGLPITFPTTTGVNEPMTGGVIARP